jgi:hypothetical protein
MRQAGFPRVEISAGGLCWLFLKDYFRLLAIGPPGVAASLSSLGLGDEGVAIFPRAAGG